MAGPARSVRLIAVLIVLLGGIYIVFGSRLLRGPGVCDVADVLEGAVTEGPVSVRGTVDLVEPESNVIFLKDLEREEVCIDSVCLFAVIKVYTQARFEEGEETVVKGLIEHEDGFPVIVSR